MITMTIKSEDMKVIMRLKEIINEDPISEHEDFSISISNLEAKG